VVNGVATAGTVDMLEIVFADIAVSTSAGVQNATFVVFG